MKIRPVEYKVLIKPDRVGGTTNGGLHLPESTRDRQQYAVDRGVIISHGEGFFEKLPGPIPKIGDKVIYDRYAGAIIKIMENGKYEEYRLCSDKEIGAIIEEDEPIEDKFKKKEHE